MQIFFKLPCKSSVCIKQLMQAFSKLPRPKVARGRPNFAGATFPNFDSFQSYPRLFQNYQDQKWPGRPNFAGATFPNFDFFKTTKTKSGTWTTEFCRGNFPKLRLFQNYQDQIFKTTRPKVARGRPNFAGATFPNFTQNST